ncbi:hypothetical protein DFR40_3162 [Azonexus fungiphilus]|uniref:Lipoprotein n=1 Tax=Azonexus fungiphilus TaxID=146940 RepID=A0A495VKX9_9RHOO|nr:hypothetical protein [Azonexus fungiphilus]RKT50019.1 hypothetical protein DFR40_3162 [Azonexus fungiphilus]
MLNRAFLLAFALLALTGCDQVAGKLGLENPAQKEAKNDAEGRAVGSACRHSGRAIEDCYAIYGWLPKSSIYAGWREMDEYMRDNKLETIAPQLPPPEPPGTKKKRPAAATEPAAETTKEAPPAAEDKNEARSEGGKH